MERSLGDRGGASGMSQISEGLLQQFHTVVLLPVAPYLLDNVLEALLVCAVERLFAAR
jgi:hypothetical protein